MPSLPPPASHPPQLASPRFIQIHHQSSRHLPMELNPRSSVVSEAWFSSAAATASAPCMATDNRDKQ